jgi:N-acetylglucosamine kinase-like BadF-type ATPase
MSYYLTFDGGGTKLKAAIFDDDFNIISFAASGGVNSNFFQSDEIKAHIDDSLGLILKKAEDDGIKIKAAYGAFVGATAYAESLIKQHAETPDTAITYLSEAQADLLAAKFEPDGVCVLCGTGATFFYAEKTGGKIYALGGLGSHIGDEGSGFYIGEHGIRAALEYMNGWGEPTLLRDLLLEVYIRDMKLTESADLLLDSMVRLTFEYFYGAGGKHIPFHTKVAGFTRQVETACLASDKKAIDIVLDAGEKLALQTIALFKKYNIPCDIDVVPCGGGWKTDGRIAERFKSVFTSEYPAVNILTPLLEPIAGGAVYHAYTNDLLNEKAKQTILSNFKEL